MNMKISSSKKNMFQSNLSLKKKYFYYSKLNNSISKLKSILAKKQNYKQKLSLLTKKKSYYSKKQIDGLIVVYIISFSFSATNTFLHVTDSLGNLKFKYSAGLFDFKGKRKKSRIQVLKRFLRELKKLKIVSTLQNKPVALHLTNIGSYKYFIIKNLKKNFFIRLVKSYETFPFNGCRKRKKLRK